MTKNNCMRCFGELVRKNRLSSKSSRFCILSAILIASLLAIPVTSPAQSVFERTYGGSEGDDSQAVQQTTDGDYVVAGKTRSYGAGGSDVYLIKTDADGDTIWTKTYGGTEDDQSNSIVQTMDGGYLLSGYTISFGAGDYDFYMIKTDASGDTLWAKTYGGTANEFGFSSQQTSDGGFVITGDTYSYGEGPQNVYLIRTDASGDTLWTKTYGGSGYEGGRSVRQTTDGGYIIGGWASSFGAGDRDYYLIKTDSAGDTLWTRTYGGTVDEKVYSLQQTTDGGYIVAGYTTSFGADSSDAYMVRTDAAGDTLWTRRYGGDSWDYAASVCQTSDGGFAIAGYTLSFGAGDVDVYLIRTDSSGDTLWTRTYGGSDRDYGLSIQETSDGGFVISGSTESYGAGGYDVYLIKVDENGTVGIGGSETPPSLPRTFSLSQNYPNPFNPSTTIGFDLPEISGNTQPVALTIYDLRGRRVRTLIDSELESGIYNVHWDGRDDRGKTVSSGIYLYTLKAESEAHTRKMTVLK